MTDIGPLNGAPQPFRADLRFEYKRPPLSLNDRKHHMVKAKLTAQVRADTVRLGARLPALTRCVVTLTWFVTDKRVRDDENPVPTLKAMCDALVDLGVVPDDTNKFMVKRMPIIQWIPKSIDAPHMVLTVETFAEVKK